jgi:tetratricopeptide (TPR) repeat protein
MYLGALAQSDIAEERQKARVDIPRYISIDLEGSDVSEHDPEDVNEDISLVGLLLDALHEDNMTKEAVKISKRMMDLFPNDSRVIRNYARSLSHAGDWRTGLELYRKAAVLPDSSDTAAVWLGNQLHNRRRNRDALEAYALACKRDPNDSLNFAHTLGELSICIEQGSSSEGSADNQLPEELTVKDVVSLASCSISCPNFDDDAANRIRRSFELLDLPTEDLDNTKTRAVRKAEADRIYNLVKSELTTPVRKSPTE